jgi:hypothetical protein
MANNTTGVGAGTASTGMTMDQSLQLQREMLAKSLADQTALAIFQDEKASKERAMDAFSKAINDKNKGLKERVDELRRQ